MTTYIHVFRSYLAKKKKSTLSLSQTSFQYSSITIKFRMKVSSISKKFPSDTPFRSSPTQRMKNCCKSRPLWVNFLALVSSRSPLLSLLLLGMSAGWSQTQKCTVPHSFCKCDYSTRDESEPLLHSVPLLLWLKLWLKLRLGLELPQGDTGERAEAERATAELWCHHPL